MMVLHDEPLSKYTTIGLGGQAKNIFFPKTVEELKEIMCSTRSKYILGGGSNLLINDNKVFDNVICLREFNTFILHESNGLYQVGAGVRL